MTQLKFKLRDAGFCAPGVKAADGGCEGGVGSVFNVSLSAVREFVVNVSPKPLRGKNVEELVVEDGHRVWNVSRGPDFGGYELVDAEKALFQRIIGKKNGTDGRIHLWAKVKITKRL